MKNLLTYWSIGVVAALTFIVVFSVASHHNTTNTVVNISQDFNSKDWGGDIVEIYGLSWPQEFHVNH